MDNKKLFIGNLPWSVNTDALRSLFSSYGEISEVEVIIDRNTGQSKGFGFITFSSEEDAQKAINEMNGKEIEGRKILVNVAKPREEKNNIL